MIEGFQQVRCAVILLANPTVSGNFFASRHFVCKLNRIIDDKSAAVTQIDC